MKPMNTYVDLSEVGIGKLKSLNPKLDDKELQDRAISKLDAKLYFKKLEYNEIVKKINTYKDNRTYDIDLLEIQYNAISREVQVLEYINKKIKL
jgi:hypothetical protein